MRRLPRTFVSAVLVGLLAVGAVVMAGTASAAKPAKDRYALGDSVMLGAKYDLKDRGFAIVDAAESRQAYSGPALLRQRGDNLPKNVVIHLGTNGTFPLSVCKAMVKAAGPDRRVFLVNVHVPRSWKKSNNQMIQQCDEAFSADRVHVIDWDAAASSNPGWLYNDRTHLRPAGAAGFARLIDDSVTKALKDAHAAAVSHASGSGTAGTKPA